MKNVTTFAFTAALVTGLASAAFAGSVTETSSTWKPGFYADDNGLYERTVHVDQDTGYNAGLDKVQLVERSYVAKEGFEPVGGNWYERSYIVKNQNASASAEVSANRTTWAPGFFLDDNGSYIKL